MSVQRSQPVRRVQREKAFRRPSFRRAVRAGRARLDPSDGPRYNPPMPPKKQRAASWAACKQVIAKWPRPGVVALVKELYELSDANRRFLHGRLLENLSDSNREDAYRAMAKLLNADAVLRDRFRHIDVKRVVDQYHKATGDDAGVATLLVADLDATCRVFAEVGDFEPLVDHAYASMERLHKTLERLESDAARPIVEKLSHVAERWDGQFGYGLSDELAGLAAEWQERLKARNTP